MKRKLIGGGEMWKREEEDGCGMKQEVEKEVNEKCPRIKMTLWTISPCSSLVESVRQENSASLMDPLFTLDLLTPKVH